jgi:hypothetical protein
MAELYTASGAKLYIAPSVASEPVDAAAYAALTWTEVGFLSNIGEYGDEASLQTGAVIGDARVRKAKGSRDAGTLTITVYPDPEDDGQTALIAAEATNNNYPIKIVEPNRLNATGTDGIDYMIVLVSSKRKALGGNDTIVTRTFNAAVNSKITEVAPTAGS